MVVVAPLPSTLVDVMVFVAVLVQVYVGWGGLGPAWLVGGDGSVFLHSIVVVVVHAGVGELGSRWLSTGSRDLRGSSFRALAFLLDGMVSPVCPPAHSFEWRQPSGFVRGASYS